MYITAGMTLPNRHAFLMVFLSFCAKLVRVCKDPWNPNDVNTVGAIMLHVFSCVAPFPLGGRASSLIFVMTHMIIIKKTISMQKNKYLFAFMIKFDERANPNVKTRPIAGMNAVSHFRIEASPNIYADIKAKANILNAKSPTRAAICPLNILPTSISE
ncbi:hypothetical protein FACS1894113_1060 [Alphaproteobacteria bacterium]|nr:hypothetical protein FACS1894113_1060 [Alphaproteobacteria bacterium]